MIRVHRRRHVRLGRHRAADVRGNPPTLQPGSRDRAYPVPSSAPVGGIEGERGPEAFPVRFRLVGRGDHVDGRQQPDIGMRQNKARASPGIGPREQAVLGLRLRDHQGQAAASGRI